MKLTCQSEYGVLQSVFIKKAADAFIDQNTIAREWKTLNFLSEPNNTAAQQESKLFEELLRKNGSEIKFFSNDDSVTMDSIYCRDASIATDKGMIICNMGKPARKNEPGAAAKVYGELNVPILGTIKSPGTVEGGDVAWLDPKTLAVGRTYRTNDEGIRPSRFLIARWFCRHRRRRRSAIMGGTQA